MYKEGQIIAVNGNLYEYGGVEDADYTKDLKLHKVYEIDIDEEGNLIPTYETNYFTIEELTNNEAEFTETQWYGIVEHFLRNDYDLEEEEVKDAAEEIVGRCFTYRVPKIEELANYIAEYMNR